MQAVDTRLNGPTAAMPKRFEHDLEIVLAPLTRPELGEIRIDRGPFAVGRNEPPFAAYDEDILMMLSRHHARLFCEQDSVYLTDEGSRNGTTRNRERIGSEPCRLSDGDEIGFAGVLSFRVKIAPGAGATGRGVEGKAEITLLTLTPAAEDSALTPIVVARFPFLVGKSDAAFASCREHQPAQLGYLSRRHAHLFSRDGGAWIEDLGSTNGTFVDGLRLQEHAVPLEDGMLLAFGGDHFTYRVSLGQQAASVAAATTALVVSDKTTFVAAPTSFLEIFCAEDPPLSDADVQAAAAPMAPLPTAVRRRPRGRILLLWSELANLGALGLGLDDCGNKRRAWRASALVLAVLAGGVALFLHGAPRRALEDALARGDHAQAAALADRALEGRPDDVALKAQATQAALEANVPAWLAAVQARDFNAARSVLAGMAPLAARNPDLRPMLGELAWLGDLERLVAERGGADAPIRIYADEERIAALVERWNDNTGEHQRTLARIASHVPPFAVAFADALTHLRKLQSDAMVYLPAIERLKAAIAAELERDSAPSIAALLDAFATKYPGVGGLDVLRQDLAHFVELDTATRAPQSGRLFAALQCTRFATPPFQSAFRTLAAQRQLPPTALVEQYALATQAWQQGRADEAQAALRKLAAGRWADAIGSEWERRQAVLAQHAALQASREIGYGEQLLVFRATLDADEDVFFARATQADLAQHKDKALARAGEAMNKARALWQEYQNGGAIEARQRAESAISTPFRARARLLAQARALAQLATQTTTQLGATVPPSWRAVADEIDNEALHQRNALQELRNVLEPALLKDKLALLGEAKP